MDLFLKNLKICKIFNDIFFLFLNILLLRYDYYWHYYRFAPTRVATRFFWSDNGWEYLKEFTSTGMWALDVDAPIPQRMAAGLGLGLKASIFIYAGNKN